MSNDEQGAGVGIAQALSLLGRRHGRVHMVGAGGIGMAGLAFHLSKLGFEVDGCDAACSRIAQWLVSEGVPVLAGHSPEHLACGVDWLVRSGAVSLDEPEIAVARSRGLPVLLRGEVLAGLCATGRSVAVCGTHGKTTTAAMLAHILAVAGRSPSFCIGGEAPVLGAVAGVGTGGIMVAEADESDGTLALYAPELGVMANVEFDHPEHFADFSAVRACFRTFAKNVTGRLIYCADDPGAVEVAQSARFSLGYGFGPGADLRGANFAGSGRGCRFRVERGSVELGYIELSVPGLHNALNALGACAAAIELGVAFDDVTKALRAFRPVRRRLEIVAESDGVAVLSDYAHHPTELAAGVRVALAIPARRRVALFQPHRYGRTRALRARFPAAFEGMNEVVLLPVYAAWERPELGGSGADLYAEFRARSRIKTLYAQSLVQAWRYLRTVLARGGTLCVFGAGDVEAVAGWAAAELAERGAARLDPAEAWAASLAGIGLHNSRVRACVPLGPFTSLGVGGPVDFLLEVGCETDLAAILSWAGQAGAPVSLIGAGTNLLVSDLGLRGVALRLTGASFRSLTEVRPGLVRAGAGLSLASLLGWCAREARTGLEFLTGIPGSIGGAVCMNAGAFGDEIGAHVHSARVMKRNGACAELVGSDMGFAYRSCSALRETILLDVTLAVEPDGRSMVQARIRELARKRAWLTRLRCAGSFFRNPAGGSAGQLIEQCGLKGLAVGGAKVYEGHANVFVAGPDATASDVWALAEIVEAMVLERTGLALEREVVCLE